MGKLKLLLSYQNFMYCTRSFVIVRAGGTGSWRFRPDGALRSPAPGTAAASDSVLAHREFGSNAADLSGILSGQTRPAYICRAQTSPGQNAGQVCGICKFSFARKSSDTAAVPGAELRSAPSGRNAGRRFYEKRCKSAASFIADSGAVRYNRNIPARHTGTFLLQTGYALQNGRGEAEYGSME